MSFSENGYYLATGLKGNTVKLWDLRKLTNFHTIELPEGQSVSKVRFDASAQYLGVAHGNQLRYIISVCEYPFKISQKIHSLEQKK